MVVESAIATMVIEYRQPARIRYRSTANSQVSWRPIGPDVEEVSAQYADPLAALARAEIPAILLRESYDSADCRFLIERLVGRGLMRDPLVDDPDDRRTRIDIGTSLGNKGGDKEDFLAHAAETRALFSTLFAGVQDPVETLYERLQALAPDKKVQTAREPDGRQYGPAIFRVHYDSHAYKPHIDHVSLREKRFDYEVSRFTHQFAGILCVQNADARGPGVQSILHRCLWTEEIQPQIAEQRFGEYAEVQGIEHCRVELGPGDLYFFNTRCVHEVPAVSGDDPRVVLAVFIGYAEDDGEIYVWS